jgi:hypothetical protein
VPPYFDGASAVPRLHVEDPARTNYNWNIATHGATHSHHFGRMVLFFGHERLLGRVPRLLEEIE